MAGDIQPLDNKFSIVDAQGRPTEYFTRWAQQKQIDIGNGITSDQATALIVAYLLAHELQEGIGIQITPSGNLTDDPMISADTQAILDEITATRGAILYRGSLGWAALAPGTAGNFLQTAGPGADPLWAAGGGGGGGLTVFFAQNNVSGSTGATPTAQTAVISVAIPAAAVARTFLVNGNISWRTGIHGMRGGVLLDATQVWPNVVGSNQGADPIDTGDGLDHLQYAGILVTVPGDGLAHNISLSWESQTSTAALTIENRQITAIKIA